MAEDIQQAQDEPIEETPDVEAHSGEVLGLQGIPVSAAPTQDGVMVESCSSCNFSVC